MGQFTMQLLFWIQPGIILKQCVAKLKIEPDNACRTHFGFVEGVGLRARLDGTFATISSVVFSYM